jgi:hypothetical protein
MPGRLSACRSLNSWGDRTADKTQGCLVAGGWRARTKPQAPRMLACAILRLYGPKKIAISALQRKVTTH